MTRAEDGFETDEAHSSNDRFFPLVGDVGLSFVPPPKLAILEEELGLVCPGVAPTLIFPAKVDVEVTMLSVDPIPRFVLVLLVGMNGLLSFSPFPAVCSLVRVSDFRSRSMGGGVRPLMTILESGSARAPRGGEVRTGSNSDNGVGAGGGTCEGWKLRRVGDEKGEWFEEGIVRFVTGSLFAWDGLRLMQR
jgi:hypothetical protein